MSTRDDAHGLIYRVTGLGISEATVREPARFRIVAVDANGAMRNLSGMSFQVAIRGVARVHPRIELDEEGCLVVDWRPSMSGSYYISITKDGLPMPGSPFHVHAATPEPHAAQCLLRGEALKRAIAREPQEFLVYFRDRLGATTHAVDLDVFVESADESSPRGRRTGEGGAGGRATGQHSRGDAKTGGSAADDESLEARGLPSPHDEDPASRPKHESPNDQIPPTHTWEAASQHSRRGDTDGGSGASGEGSGDGSGGGNDSGDAATAAAGGDSGGGREGGGDGSGGGDCVSGGSGGAMKGAPSDVVAGIFDMVAPGAMAGHAQQQASTRVRRIRVKVGPKPLVVRAGPELTSDQIGQLMPGTVVTVIEERIARGGNVRACVALDRLDKEDATGHRTERGFTFRSSSLSVRADARLVSVRGEGAAATAAAAAAAAPGGALAAVASSRRGGGGGAFLTPHCVVAGEETGSSSPTAAALTAGVRNGLSSARALPPEAAAGRCAVGVAGSSSMSIAPSAAAGRAAISTGGELDSMHGALEPSARQFVEAAAAAGAAHAKHRRKLPLTKLRTGAGVAPGGQLSHRGPLSQRDRGLSQCGAHASVTHRAPPPRAHIEGAAVTVLAMGGPAAIHNSPQPHMPPAAGVAVASAASEDAAGVGGASLSELTGWSTGWVTLVKNGEKLVSSRLRLDVDAKRQQRLQWSRRLGNDRQMEERSEQLRDGHAKQASVRSRGGPTLSRSVSLELSSDPYRCGAIYAILSPRGSFTAHSQRPLPLACATHTASGRAFEPSRPIPTNTQLCLWRRLPRHPPLSRGPPRESQGRLLHRCLRKVWVYGGHELGGRAGGGVCPLCHALRALLTVFARVSALADRPPLRSCAMHSYLLHVRLRGQAAALAGSPFHLQVDPGPAYALSSSLPYEPIDAEVGEPIRYPMRTADKIGNACHRGGAAVTMWVGAGGRETKEVRSSCTDHDDGTYMLEWSSERPGVFEVHVRVGGLHVVNSPAVVRFHSTRPVISNSEVVTEGADGEGTQRAVVGEPARIRLRLRDAYGNMALPCAAYRETFRVIYSFVKGRSIQVGGQGASELSNTVAQGEWHAPDSGEYVAIYVPSSANQGFTELHLFCDTTGTGERAAVPGSPFHLSISANSNEVVSNDLDTTGAVVLAQELEPLTSPPLAVWLACLPHKHPQVHKCCGRCARLVPDDSCSQVHECSQGYCARAPSLAWTAWRLPRRSVGLR